MSESMRYRWSVQAAIRRQAYLERITANTTRFHSKYCSLLGELEAQGLSQYVPGEFAQIRTILADIERYLREDPERARDLSIQVGPEIGRLPSMARAAKREFEARERQVQKEFAELRRRATSEVARFVQALISDIRDPIERAFAFEKMRVLQDDLAGRVVDPQDLPAIKDDIRQRADAIRADARARTAAWKDLKSQETAREALGLLLELHREQASAEKYGDAIPGMLACLDVLQQEVSTQAFSMDDLQKRISVAAAATDSAIVDEKCRKVVVRAVMDALEQSGFIVSKPQRQLGEKDEVVILARRPAGAEATFRVTADGAMVYMFDRYEGMKCKADIDQILPMLQEVYGINLSEARILWQNPDGLFKSAKPLDDGSEERGRG